MATLCIAYANLTSGPIKTALTTIAVVTAIIGVTQINLFYKPNGSLRNFGTGSQETIVPAWLAITAVGWVVYLLSATSDTLAISLGHH